MNIYQKISVLKFCESAISHPLNDVAIAESKHLFTQYEYEPGPCDYKALLRRFQDVEGIYCVPRYSWNVKQQYCMS